MLIKFDLKMETTIILQSEIVGNDTQRMTSLEIAELTGKQHKNVMQAIRNMEPAWEKTCGLKFQLTSRAIVQPNGGTREVPCYSLTKTECLYIATKFNDEARARLVLRWEELERRSLNPNPKGERRSLTPNPIPAEAPTRSLSPEGEGSKFRQVCLPEPKQILALADRIIGEGLRLLNADAEDTLTATQVAKTFNMRVCDFNQVVSDMGIQYRRHGHWNISDDLKDRDLVRLRTYISYSLKGEKKIRTYMTWTLKGLRYLNAKLGYPNF